MAFKAQDREGNIKVVLFADGCVKCDQAEYDKYLESFKDGKGDESLLKLDGVPSRFVCKKSLEWMQTTRLRSKNIKIIGKKANVNPNYNSDLVRRHLVEIENPAGAEGCLKFEREADGFAGFKIIAQLDAANAITDLAAAITSATKIDVKREEEEKK